MSSSKSLEHTITAKVITADDIAAIVASHLENLASELPGDVLAALQQAHQAESNQAAKNTLDLLIKNADLAAQTAVPLCQDTGTVWVYIEIGARASVQLSFLQDRLNRVVADSFVKQHLRASTVRDALTDRSNPGTNLPAFIDCVYLPVTESGNGDDSTASDSSADYSVRVSTMLKGGGSDNSSIVTMLPPAADLQQAGGQTEAAITQLLLNLVAEKGSNACPPLIVGIGVGATFDKVASLSKRALLRPLDQSSANPLSADLERRLLGKLNASNIGPAGLGGDTTALAVHIETAASHIASLPVAINLGCHSLRRKTTAITSAFPTDF